LVVDDEQSIIDLVTAYLHKEGYEVYTAMDGPAGLKAARVFRPDLIVLDIMLPGMDGIEVLSLLRRESDVYVIMLTVGTSTGKAAKLAFRHVRIDAGRRQVWVDEEPVELTAIQFDLLKTLAEHRGLVLSRDQLLEKVWGYDFYGEERVVDVHVGHIRQKLGNDRFIATVRGVGYRFEDEAV
jgi:two-component system alkaline phosphatase synthesis response regulator PhoP